MKHALVLVSLWRLTMRNPGTKITAYFDKAVGVYAGSEVKVLGVSVGHIDTVTPQGNTVRVDFTVDDGIEIPAETRRPPDTPNPGRISGCPDSSRPLKKGVRRRCERRGARCEAPRRRRCQSASGRSGNKADGPARLSAAEVALRPAAERFQQAPRGPSPGF